MLRSGQLDIIYRLSLLLRMIFAFTMHKLVVFLAFTCVLLKEVYHPANSLTFSIHMTTFAVQDMLEYKSKIRLLKVYTMDGAVKTVQV
jgi:hypothetical protein